MSCRWLVWSRCTRAPSGLVWNSTGFWADLPRAEETSWGTAQTALGNSPSLDTAMATSDMPSWPVNQADSREPSRGSRRSAAACDSASGHHVNTLRHSRGVRRRLVALKARQSVHAQTPAPGTGSRAVHGPRVPSAPRAFNRPSATHPPVIAADAMRRVTVAVDVAETVTAASGIAKPTLCGTSLLAPRSFMQPRTDAPRSTVRQADANPLSPTLSSAGVAAMPCDFIAWASTESIQVMGSIPSGGTAR
mmetsp:Transcript_24174/g.60000  ORF Transcript_24174/g.60000 Transcript_24174/m.60000 type:complete len:249 (-) Transcript_24174:297-1043(-)